MCVAVARIERNRLLEPALGVAAATAAGKPGTVGYQRCGTITGASFILMHQKQDKPQNAVEVLKFFDWALKDGQKMAAELDYVPMPEGVMKIIADAWKTQLKDSSGKPIL